MADVSFFFLQYCFCETILAVLSRKNGVKVYMLYHEGANFSRVIIAMAKNSTSATSNVYQAYLNVGRKLAFVARTRIFDF